MGLFVPSAGDFKWWVSNGASRPAAAYGTALTPGTAPAFGSWTQILSAATVTQDVYGILLNFNSFASSATTRNVLISIGVDNAGGTSYRTVIPNLLGGNSAPYTIGSGGQWYYFPLFIPAGSSIAAQGSGNVTNAGRVYATVFGQPKRPESVRTGQIVFSFGENVVTATGTIVSLGTTNEGAWVQAGSATPMPLWWWQTGYTCVDTTMTASMIHCDCAAGDATNKKILIQDNPVVTTTAEQISNLPTTVGCVANVGTGSLVYVRGQCSGNGDANTSMMAWGMG